MKNSVKSVGQTNTPNKGGWTTTDLTNILLCNFKGSEIEYSAEIVAQDVTINCSAGDHNHGSSKVKLKNVVNYPWELKYYVGQLIAAHVGGKVYAYAIKVKSVSMIRVSNVETDQRTLIKELKGNVQDISFALTPLQVILGCVDEEGNMFVYNITHVDTNLSFTLLLHVIHPNAMPNQCNNYQVIWCPYVPTYGEDSDTYDDPAKLLALLNGNKAEVWDVSIVNSKYGAGPLEASDKYEGFVEIDGHLLDVVDASFSPDGTALATASLDGYVKFFQVYRVDLEEPRCLHQWQPHDGEALSCLMFLDNVNTYGITDSKFWKFAITGANHNAELKIWSCETWSCLQTIRFEHNPISLIPNLFFKVTIDMSAEFLIMSDINNRILYVLQIQKNQEERHASVATISEFLLPASVISFCIISAGADKFSNTSSTEDLYRDEVEDFEDDSNIPGVGIKMYVVQPKSLQECTVTYKPEGSMSSNIKSVYGNILDTSDSVDVILDDLAEDETITELNDVPKLNDLKSSVTLLIQQQSAQASLNQVPILTQIPMDQVPLTQVPLTLMTPDDFNSPVLNASPNNVRNSLVDLTSPNLKKDTNETTSSSEALIDFEAPQKDNCASGGSSPSREVQEIMALNNPSFTPQEYFDNLNKMEDDAEIPSNDFNKVDGPTDGAPLYSSDGVWANIPIMKAIELEETRSKEMKLNKEIAEPEQSWNKAQIQALNYRLLNLESLIREQNSQIQNLQCELKTQSSNAETEYDIRTMFVKELDSALTKHQLHTTKYLEGILKDQKRKEREQYEIILTTISTTLAKQVTENLQAIILREVQNQILPPVLQIFEKLKHQLDMQYSQKLNTIDQLMKVNIGKLFHNKTIADSLSLSIINVIKPSLENCYKDMIGTTLIPSWEKVCSTMFQQIHSTFMQGTKEYTSSVETYMERQRKVQDKGKDIVNQIQNVSETMRSNADKLSGNISSEMQRQITIAFNSMQDKLSAMITELVRDQVRIGFRTHAAVLEDTVANAVRSRAVTPAPHIIDTQAQIAQINSLILKGNIDTAFQQALSASATVSDLSLVLYVCEKVNPQDVFSTGNCILQQHVLLSLIQQLGADLTRHTEVKHRYLQEAILNLEPTNMITREHVPIVLKELIKQLTNFVATNGSNKNITNMRMLLMATKALTK